MLDDLDASLGRAIDAVRSEGYSPGVSNGANENGDGRGGSALSMFEQWRTELDRLRAGDRPVPSSSNVPPNINVGAGVGTGEGVVRGRSTTTRPEHDPSSAESGGMFVD